MKHAWIKSAGTIYPVTVNNDNSVVTQDNKELGENEFDWLPPLHGTVFALALNYADHASELEFKPPEQPLIFIKAPSTFIGHRQNTCRPDAIDYMHYECELVAVIGKTAHKVKRGDAEEYISGYTLCNDYAIRDYLENYYRPNLKVKSHDSLSPLGPYIVDRQDVIDPYNLRLRTYVNDEIRQEGNTRDMIFDIPYLIEYLSRFMTLQPGDMISTGTPQGLSNVMVGDEVTIEIDQVGRLTNYIVSEKDYFSDR